MKHLKKFEELDIKTYIEAGEKLRKTGHTDRGQKMIDWAKRGQLDETPELNIWIKWMSTYQAGRGSKEVLSGIINETPIKVKVQMVHINIDTLSDDIEYHKEQNSFPVSMTVSFSMDESELEKIKPEYLSVFKSETSGDQLHHNRMPSGSFYKLWTMELSTYFKLDESGNISSVSPVGFFTYGEMGSMFSDRRSANNFKNILKKILSNEIKVYTGYKDEDDGRYLTNSEAMFSIFSREIPTIEISDVEEVIDAFKNINTNILYNENPKEATKRISN